MATIYDVAKRAKVSTYTVSSVLNRTAFVSPALTARVEKAVRALDYTVNGLARGLQTRRTHTLGMLIPDIANPFYAKVVRGVEDVCRADNYSLLLGNNNNKAEEQFRYLSAFRSKQVDGILLFITPGGDKDVLQLIKKQIPVVLIGRLSRNVQADSVTADNRQGAFLATNHLIGNGHQRIAIITGPFVLSANKHRVEGWKKAMLEAGHSAPAVYAREGDWYAESAEREAGILLDGKSPPTAFFAANFLMMTGILKALKDRGLKCPADVEVVSSDDSEWLDVFQPPISTVVQPSYEMGLRAAELLMARIKSPEKPVEKIVLKPGFQVRR